MKERGFESEVETIRQGQICSLHSRLANAQFPEDCVMWLPSANESQISEFWKHHDAVERFLDAQRAGSRYRAKKNNFDDDQEEGENTAQPPPKEQQPPTPPQPKKFAFDMHDSGN